MKIFLALPAYNEEQGLPHLLEAFQREVALPGHPVRVVIVDDGSKDGTRRVIEDWSSRMPIDLVIHRVNRGLGETILHALQRAAELAAPEDVIVTMDADNTHSPALIPQMVRQLEAGSQVVIASRYRRGSAVVGLNAFRHLMSFGARLLFRIVFPLRGVRDYTCGFRAYRAELLQRAFMLYGTSLVTERSFASMAEVLLKLGKMGARMSEVPMVLRYDQKQSASKMRVARTVFNTLRLLARNRFAAAPAPESSDSK